MKRSPLLIAAAALMFALALAGCNGGSGGAAAGIAASDSAGTVPVPGSGDGSAGTGQTSVTLSWDAPVLNTNGTSLTDLSGYTIQYGTTPGSSSGKVNVGLLTTCSLTGLAPGTYYFTVTAFNAAGAESAPSNEVSKAVTL